MLVCFFAFTLLSDLINLIYSCSVQNPAVYYNFPLKGRIVFLKLWCEVLMSR